MAAVSTTMAQKSNLVFFTEQGERFTVVLNGIQQNASPETNVMVTGLPAPSYKLKIIFEDPAIGELDKNLMFNQGAEITFVIKKNNKGEYVVRYMNEVQLAQAPPPPQDRQVVLYTTTPPPPATRVTQTTTSTTTTTNAAPAGGVAVGVSVTDPATGVDYNMSVVGMTTTAGTATSTSTTTTTMTTTTTGADYHDDEVVVAEQRPAYALPGYTGPIGCPWPMSRDEFMNVKNSISSKSFEDSKLTIAKQVINSNCLLCSQVKEIMLLFTYEDTRLELAKHAYGYTYDIGNYYQLNDAFTYESSIEELNEYINGFTW